MNEQHLTVPSGIPPFEDRVGGVLAGRMLLMSGGAGTGKSTAALQFVREGLRHGESAAILTADRTGDVRSHAAFLDVDLETPLRTGRLVLLRYRASFAALLRHAAVPEQMLDDLRRLLLPLRPTRVVVDSVLPLLSSSARSDVTLGALADLLEEIGATTLMTYAGDLTAGRGIGYDHRIEPLLERAATVVHLSRRVQGEDTRRRGVAPAPAYELHVVRARQPIRSAGAASYAITAMTGIERMDSTGQPDGTAERSARALALGTAAAPSDELLAVPRRDFVVESQEVRAGAPVPDPAADAAALILVELRRDTIERDLALISDLCAHLHAVPVVGVSSMRLRSTDRARALRAGATDVLSCDAGPAELLARLHGIVQRGSSPLAVGGRDVARRTETLLMQPTEPADGTHTGIRYRPLDRDGFAHALAAHVANDQPTQYTVVTVVPARAPAISMPTPALPSLADAVMRTMRVGSGDLAAVMDGRVCVYLHGARLGDASCFVARIRERWTASVGGDLDVASFGYPSDEPQLQALIGSSDREARAIGVAHRVVTRGA